MADFFFKNPVFCIWIAYLLLISVVSVIVCVYDKKISRKNRVELRVPEKRLFFFSLIGGSLAMYLTMLAVRHKTKHFRFMFGIPCIMILQAAILFALFYFGILKVTF